MAKFKKIVGVGSGANLQVRLEGENKPVSIVDAFNNLVDQLNELAGPELETEEVEGDREGDQE